VTAAGDGVGLGIDSERLDIDARFVAVTGRVLVTVAGAIGDAQARAWLKGRQVRAPVLLRRPARYLNPGVPDHERALLRRGIALVGTIKSGRLVEVVRRGRWADEWAAGLRMSARTAIDREIGCHDVRSAAIVRAILIGDRTGLDDETQERLQAAGTYHVLAISGGNIAILAGLILLGLRVCAVRAPVAEGTAAVALVVYAWIVGGGPSVNRATLMAVTLLAAHAIDHRSHPLNALSVAGAIGLAIDPHSVFDPGAWLTYGATFAIVVAAERCAGRLREWPIWWRAPAGLLLASAAAEAALFPVSAFVFSRVTAAGLVLNFVAIPLMTVVQIGGIATILAGSISSAVAATMGWVTHEAAWGLVESGRLVDVAPWLTARVPAPDAWALAAYYAGWAGVLGLPWARSRWPRHVVALQRSRSLAGAMCLASGAWMVSAPVVTFGADTRMTVTFIDVGQGDATLVRFPLGHTLLVDTGGAGGSRFDIGRRVVVPAIWSQGVRRLSYLLVTHGDGDHLNGAEAVVRDLRPLEVWEGVPVPPHEGLAALRQAASAAGATWRVVQRGDRLSVDGVDVCVWHPPLADWERQRVRNDDSVVIELRYGGVSVVLPGDVEEAAEQTIGPLFPDSAIRILQAPHHGSASSASETFLNEARPALGVVSVGRGNRFGHPHAGVLRRFRALGVPVVRTDRHGAITVTTDGRAVRVTTYTGEAVSLPAAPRRPVR